jgi:HK97 family phage portal protein
VFEQPNPLVSEFELFELSSTYKDLGGTCFWLIIEGRDRLPSQLWPLRPDLVGVLPSNKDPRIYAWAYKPDERRPDRWVVIPRDMMIVVKYPNPNPRDPAQRYFGRPPLRAAARATTLDNAATDFVDTLLRNHAMPSTVVETESVMTDAIHSRLRSIWKRAFGGPNRGEPAFLQKGMKVHELGLTLTNLEFPDLRAVSETRICMPFGVPPILVGAKVGLEHNAYKDFREARLQFWEETMLPEQRRFIDPIRGRLLKPFLGVGRRSVRVAWDNSEVLALKEALDSKWSRATNALARGGITVNDFRMEVELPTVPGGNVFLVPAGVVPTVALDEAGAAAAAAQAEVVSASIELTAAEYGIELSERELLALKSSAEVFRD